MAHPHLCKRRRVHGQLDRHHRRRADGSVAKQIKVENHDVAITKFSVPQSARAGQTRQISVAVNNKLHDEWVTVKPAENPGLGTRTN